MPKRSLTNLSGTITGVLNMGISHHWGLYRLPPVLKRFSDLYPEVRASETAYDEVLQGKTL